jgi:cell division protein FtsL
MPKRIKITLYVILILVIIAVVWLMFWQTNLKTETPVTLDTEEILTEQEIPENNWDTIDLEPQENTFENDVMNDLEWFFNDNNGYEDIEWEFWFTSLETE